jgi:hypothetical protein
MLSYADKVIVNGMSSKSCISSLLYSSDIGRHTSILFLHNHKDQKNLNTLSVARFIWNMRPKGPTPTHSPSTAPSVTRFSHGVLQTRLSGKMDPRSLSPATPRNGKGDTPSSALGRLRLVRTLPPLLLPHPMLVGGIRTTWVRVWTRMWLGVKLRPWLKDK